jgi:hypothetical protein
VKRQKWIPRDRLVSVSPPPQPPPYAQPVGSASRVWTWIVYPTMVIFALTVACVVLATGIRTGKPLWEFALVAPLAAALLARWVWAVPVRYRREQAQTAHPPEAPARRRVLPPPWRPL